MNNNNDIPHEGCIIQLLSARKDNIVFVVPHYVSSAIPHSTRIAQACAMRYGYGAKRQQQQEKKEQLSSTSSSYSAIHLGALLAGSFSSSIPNSSLKATNTTSNPARTASRR